MTPHKLEQLKSVIIKANPDKFSCRYCGRLKIEKPCQAAKHKKYSIYLVDILLAMQKLKADDENRHHVVNRLGDFLIDNKDLKGTVLVKPTWNLKEDNLNNQSEEIKEFLYNLLVKEIV